MFFGPHDCSIPRQMATFSSQPTVKRPLAASWGGGCLVCRPVGLACADSPPCRACAGAEAGGPPLRQEDEETLPDIRCLVATAVITLFNVSDTIRG